MTDSERELLKVMADVFQKQAKQCVVSGAKAASPYGESFHATHIVLCAIADDLLAQAERKEP